MACSKTRMPQYSSFSLSLSFMLLLIFDRFYFYKKENIDFFCLLLIFYAIFEVLKTRTTIDLNCAQKDFHSNTGVYNMHAYVKSNMLIIQHFCIMKLIRYNLFSYCN